MAIKRTQKALMKWALIGFVVGYGLARIFQRSKPAFPAPLSAVLQDSIDIIADLRRSNQDAEG